MRASMYVMSCAVCSMLDPLENEMTVHLKGLSMNKLVSNAEL